MEQIREQKYQGFRMMFSTSSSMGRTAGSQGKGNIVLREANQERESSLTGQILHIKHCYSG
jgi:hypothetical protein